jgi:hypothetical protein
MRRRKCREFCATTWDRHPACPAFQDAAIGGGRGTSFESPRVPRIPTGFRRKAQGCEERATQGKRPKNVSNRNGNLCKSGARLCEPQHAPLEIKLLRVTDPRSASRNAPFAEVSNPVATIQLPQVHDSHWPQPRWRSLRKPRSAGFQTCCVADFQVGSAWNWSAAADVEIRDTADLEVCATGMAFCRGLRCG